MFIQYLWDYSHFYGIYMFIQYILLYLLDIKFENYFFYQKYIYNVQKYC